MDAPVRPNWVPTAQAYDTTNAAPDQTYVVQSQAYDLETFNAIFPQPATVTRSENEGSILLEYAVSADGATYTDFTSELGSLSFREGRYLKWRATIGTASVAGSSPAITRIAIPFEDGGPGSLSLSLTAGCGTLEAVGAPGHRRDSSPHSALLLFGTLTGVWLAFRARSGPRTRTT